MENARIGLILLVHGAATIGTMAATAAAGVADAEAAAMAAVTSSTVAPPPDCWFDRVFMYVL